MNTYYRTEDRIYKDKDVPAILENDEGVTLVTLSVDYENEYRHVVKQSTKLEELCDYFGIDYADGTGVYFDTLKEAKKAFKERGLALYGIIKTDRGLAKVAKFNPQTKKLETIYR